MGYAATDPIQVTRFRGGRISALRPTIGRSTANYRTAPPWARFVVTRRSMLWLTDNWEDFHVEPGQVCPARVGDAAAVVQHHPRPVRAASAAAAPRHPSARRAGRPWTAVPDRADHAGGLGRPARPDPRARARRLPAVAAHPAVPSPAA